MSLFATFKCQLSNTFVTVVVVAVVVVVIIFAVTVVVFTVGFVCCNNSPIDDSPKPILYGFARFTSIGILMVEYEIY